MAALAVFVTLLTLPRRAPATIAEQRARLPPAAECDDEVIAGVWRSHSFRPRYRQWTVFTLVVRRDPDHPEQLTGTITNHFWQGTREEEEPPPCERQREFEAFVSMDARGHVGPGNHIVFGGVGQWRTDRMVCGGGFGGYNLDSFSGVVDPAILEFQSVNNDGGTSVNEPTVFRRIRCPPVRTAEAPSVNPVPPRFYPGDRAGGCGLF